MLNVKGIMVEMSDLLSLEDEDYGELFITQEPRENLMEKIVENDVDGEDMSLLGVSAMDCLSPMVLVVRGQNAIYSDISEDEVFETEKGNDESVRFDEQESHKEEVDVVKAKTVGNGISRVFGWNTRRGAVRKLKLGTGRTVSRKFHNVTDGRLNQLKQKVIKKRSFTKMMWGVRAYNEWRINRLNDVVNFDENIFEANLEDLSNLSKSTFEYAMCRFIAEVRKFDGNDYPGKTLYHITVSIQRYLNENNIDWKMVDGPDFKEFRVVLDNLMKERAKMNIGMVKRQAQCITMDFKNKLWSEGILGEETPVKLRNTVLFLLGLNLGLRVGDEHYDLRRDSPGKRSQLSFQRDQKGVCCLVYNEDTVTKTNDGGLKHMQNDRKTVWVYPSENVNRCPVRFVDKYVSLCPTVTSSSKKANFYLHPLEKTNPAQWYSERVLGINSLRKVVGTMLKDARLDGFFSNHSLRHSGGSRLFQAGVDRKLVKEFTGHKSDAIDQYQITSDDQRKKISEILACTKSINNTETEPIVCNEVNDKVEPMEVEQMKSIKNPSENVFQLVVNDQSHKCMGCICQKSSVNISEAEKIGQIVTNILERKPYRKALIKLEIDLSN